MINFKIVFSVLLLALPTYLLTSRVKGCDNKFEDIYRYHTLSKLSDHFLEDPNCELRELVPIIEDSSIGHFWDTNRYFRAWVIAPYRIIHINLYSDWNKNNTSITYIHEALHIAGICGEDYPRRSEPVCKLFGEDVFDSEEISKTIKRHLESKRRKR